MYLCTCTYIRIYKGCLGDSVPNFVVIIFRRRYPCKLLGKFQRISNNPPIVILSFLRCFHNSRRYRDFFNFNFRKKCIFFFAISLLIESDAKSRFYISHARSRCIDQLLLSILPSRWHLYEQFKEVLTIWTKWSRHYLVKLWLSKSKPQEKKYVFFDFVSKHISCKSCATSG